MLHQKNSNQSGDAKPISIAPLIAYEKNGLLPEETARVSVHIKLLNLTSV